MNAKNNKGLLWYVIVVAILTINSLLVYPASAKQPKNIWEYKYKLRDTGMIVAGQEQDYTVDVSVRNNSKDITIDNIHFSIRIWQVLSPNDTTHEYAVQNLAPGEIRNFSITVRYFNFQYIGHTSTPKVQVNAR